MAQTSNATKKQGEFSQLVKTYDSTSNYFKFHPWTHLFQYAGIFGRDKAKCRGEEVAAWRVQKCNFSLGK
jgi:hypothetical protein